MSDSVIKNTLAPPIMAYVAARAAHLGTQGHSEAEALALAAAEVQQFFGPDGVATVPLRNGTEATVTADGRISIGQASE